MSEKKSANFLFISLLIIFVFVFGIFSGFLFSEIKNVVYPPEDVDFSLFWETYNKLEDNFIYFDRIEREEMIYGAIEGMVNSFNDPNTIFFTPEKNKELEERLQGKFEGVGMEVGLREGEIRVISPIPNTPADRAGMRPGDVILSVDEVSTEGMSIEEAVSIIRGPKGEPVTLKIARKDLELEIVIIRDVINIPSLELEMIEGDIAHLKLYYFHEGMISEFSNIADLIANNRTKGIIVDLRNNPGGSLDVVKNIMGWFLERDSIIAVAYEGEKEYKVRGTPLFLDYPVVVLINEGSASASEIMASALRNNRQTTIVGKRSFGKGSIQTIEKLSGGSSIKITVSEFLTPNRDQINEVGVTPDIEVEWEDVEEDLQLNEAIRVLIEQIK